MINLPNAHCIILIGIKHSGKSTVAHACMEHGYTIYDIDDLIIQKNKYTRVEDVYNSMGTKAFRKMEYTELIRALDMCTALAENSVIACGGGICSYRLSKNILMQCKKGVYPFPKGMHTYIVYLRTTAQESMARFGNTLPAFLRNAKNPHAAWQHIASKRARAYASLAHVTIDSALLTPIINQSDAICNTTLQKIEQTLLADNRTPVQKCVRLSTRSHNARQ